MIRRLAGLSKIYTRISTGMVFLTAAICTSSNQVFPNGFMVSVPTSTIRSGMLD